MIGLSEFRNLGILTVVLLLSACGPGVTDVQSGCANQYTAFPDQVACVRDAVAADPDLRADTLVQEYVLTGEKLASEVKSGDLGPDDARLKWVHKLNEIRQQELDNMAQQARIDHMWGRTLPHYSNCHRAGGSMQCTGY